MVTLSYRRMQAYGSTLIFRQSQAVDPASPPAWIGRKGNCLSDKKTSAAALFTVDRQIRQRFAELDHRRPVQTRSRAHGSRCDALKEIAARLGVGLVYKTSSTRPSHAARPPRAVHSSGAADLCRDTSSLA